MRRTDQKADSVLDPIERVTEVIFGALMALTFTRCSCGDGSQLDSLSLPGDSCWK